MENRPLAGFLTQKKNFLSQMGTGKKKGKTKLILLIVANTLDPAIGEGCALDINTIRTIFGEMADHMDFNLVELVIAGLNYTNKNILNSVDALKPGKDDIVIFYYSGHGFSFEKEKDVRSPQLDLQSFPATNKIAAIEATTKNLNDIYEIIKSRGARLNIVFGDCCNDRINFNRRFIKKDTRPRKKERRKGEINKETCKVMFCDLKSSILIAAADKDVLAIVDEDKGSIYTLNFSETLRKIIEAPLKANNELPWNDLLKKTKTKTLRLSKTFDLPDGSPGNQRSFFIIE